MAIDSQVGVERRQFEKKQDVEMTFVCVTCKFKGFYCIQYIKNTFKPW